MKRMKHSDSNEIMYTPLAFRIFRSSDLHRKKLCVKERNRERNNKHNWKLC